jgi:hypothetical protein
LVGINAVVFSLDREFNDAPAGVPEFDQPTPRPFQDVLPGLGARVFIIDEQYLTVQLMFTLCQVECPLWHFRRSHVPSGIMQHG